MRTGVAQGRPRRPSTGQGCLSAQGLWGPEEWGQAGVISSAPGRVPGGRGPELWAGKAEAGETLGQGDSGSAGPGAGEASHQGPAKGEAS